MNEFVRVSHRNHCPVCDKPDWCSITENGVICMRIESDHPTRNGGWYHQTKERHEIPIKPEPHPKYVPDFAAMLSHWSRSSTTQVDALASELQLGVLELREIGTCYADVHQAYAFPMYRPSGELSGIRLRNLAGEKWAVKGSHAGLFIPWDAIKRFNLRDIFICEGPTDTAAALQLGYFAIGRHACLGQEEMIVQVIRDCGARHAYVLYDNDGPGERGADKLCAQLPCAFTKIVPPTKDLREFVVDGGSKELLLYLVSEAQRKHLKLSASHYSR